MLTGSTSECLLETEFTMEMTPVKSKFELDSLEAFLRTEDNMQSMVECLNNLITASHLAKRVSAALRIILSDDFLIQCAWLDDGSRINLKRYVNLQNLLRLIAKPGEHSLGRLKFENILKSQIDKAQNSMIHCRTIQESDSEFTVHSSSSSTNISETNPSNPEFCPVNTKEEFDRLEEFLSSDINMQSMARRINRLMSAQDAANRFTEALHIVVSDGFLNQCGWVSESKCLTRTGLQSYVNFQNLLQLLAEDSRHTLRKADLEKWIKTEIKQVKDRIRSNCLKKSVNM
uniref:DUF4806 domain-containing protein n=1 Tax=Anopheles minimus TaxID=112268 RepID=A0A182WQ64_9DIPT